MKFWIGAAVAVAVVGALVAHGDRGMAVLVALIIGLAALGNHTRRGNTEPWKLSRSRAGGQAERAATGTTVTGQDWQGPTGGF